MMTTQIRNITQDNKHTKHKQTDSPIDRTDRQSDRQTDRQTGRQADRQTEALRTVLEYAFQTQHPPAPDTRAQVM